MTKLVFIADSKQKKIKKLFFLSKDLIREYGFRYAFRIFLEELFKQKTNLFAPDTVPQLDFKQFTSDYETFKQKHVVIQLIISYTPARYTEPTLQLCYTITMLQHCVNTLMYILNVNVI